MSLTILEPGLSTLLVDAGRPASRSLGVPVGGAADRRSWMLGNALVGNPPDTPALEISLKGPTLRADFDVGAVVFGAPFVLSSNFEVGHTFNLRTGDTLTIGGTPRGMRAYLCVAGGLSGPLVLGSQSSLQPLRRGDVVACASQPVPRRSLGPACPFLDFATHSTIHVVRGLQADWFDDREFLGRDLQVTPASNRMGLRLSGTPLTMPASEMVSEAVCPGAVQVTRDGQCIVLGPDGQTIGGYPKIAQVIQTDLDKLGQLRPGDRVRFEAVSLVEAHARFELERRELHAWLTRMRVTLDGAGPPPTLA